VVLAYLFLKERLSRLQWAAAAVTVISIIAVAIY
jgi:EamA domain-containing membrane protein RarD